MADLSVKSMWAYAINVIFRVVQMISLRVVGQILVSDVCYFALVHHKSPDIKSLIQALQFDFRQIPAIQEN